MHVQLYHFNAYYTYRHVKNIKVNVAHTSVYFAAKSSYLFDKVQYTCTFVLNSLLVSGDLCRLRITLANSLDPEGGIFLSHPHTNKIFFLNHH